MKTKARKCNSENTCIPVYVSVPHRIGNIPRNRMSRNEYLIAFPTRWSGTSSSNCNNVFVSAFVKVIVSALLL